MGDRAGRHAGEGDYQNLFDLPFYFPSLFVLFLLPFMTIMT